MTPDDHTEFTLAEVARARKMARSGEAEEILRAADVSRSEVAEVVGVTPSCVSQWCRGKTRPTGPEAVRFARILDHLAGVSA